MQRRTLLILGGLGLVGLLVLFLSGVPANLRAMLSRLGAHWTNLHPEMQSRALAVIQSLAAKGIVVGIPSTGGWRSVADQQAIDPANTNVVNPLDSYHVWGLAVDFVPIDAAGSFYYPDGADPVWQQIGASIQAQGLTWGGTFTTLKDMPHGELHYESLASLKSIYTDPMAYVSANV